jgi:hypothetical protein
MPKGIIKLKYTGYENKVFTNNPSIYYYKTIYKSYVNFIKIPENIEIEDNYNISTINNITIVLNKYDYDILGNMYLCFELTTPIVNILNYIEKIELYVSDYLIDTLTPDIILLYNELFYNSTNYKTFNLLTNHNNKNIYYIPLCFYFLQNTDKYIPLYLLHKEVINLKVFFNKVENTNVIASSINLIGTYFILESKPNCKNWLIETISYNENINLKASIKADITNKIDLLFTGYIKSLFFIIRNCEFDNMYMYYNNTKVILNKKKLKYLNVLETELYHNTNNDILLYNYSLFKCSLSGYINLDTVNTFYIELNPYAIYTTIQFDVTSVFTNNYFFITTDLITSEVNQSPDIYIYTNVKYELINNNCDIIIVTTNPTDYINDPINNNEPTHVNGFDNTNKTLLLDSENKYDILYYCHKENTNNIIINYGRLLVFTDNKANAATGLINTYAINYNLYLIKNGKLFNYKFD